MAIINRGNKGNLVGTVVAVDALAENIQFCASNEEGSALLTDSVSTSVNALDAAFFDRLGEIVKAQMEKNANMDVQKVSLILPDRLFLLDTLVVPVIHRKAMQQSLSLAVEAIYQNAEELNLMTYAVQQNKQAVTFGLVGVRHDILNGARAALSTAGAPVSGITFASTAMVNGAMALNAKLRGESFLLMDVKQDCARFAFVVRGCTMGYYDLPFGHGMMQDKMVVSENTLFDHHAAEAVVKSAKEKTRAKQLVVDGVTLVSQASAKSKAASEKDIKTSKPTPNPKEGYLYENFRVFLKWAQELIFNNPEITSLAKIDTVYVNLPDRYRFLLDMANKAMEESDLTFAPLLPEGTEASIVDNLELYGGFFTGRYNEANTF